MTEEEKKWLEEAKKSPAANASDAQPLPGYEKKEDFQWVPNRYEPGEQPAVSQASDARAIEIEVQKTNPGEREVSVEAEEKAIQDAELLQEQMEFVCGKKGGGEYEYLVRGAKLRCKCGSHGRRVNLPICHGAEMEEKPLLSHLDCLVGDEEHIRAFGICSSPTYPAGNPYWLEKGMKWLFGKQYEEEIMLMGEDGTRITGYPCMPKILGTWQNPHRKTLLSEDGGERAITMESFLICAYGGWIFPETSGFEYEDPASEEEILKDWRGSDD